jgi:hypothetical protein
MAGQSSRRPVLCVAHHQAGLKWCLIRGVMRLCSAGAPAAMWRRAINSGVEALTANSQDLRRTANNSAWAFQCHPAVMYFKARK